MALVWLQRLILLALILLGALFALENRHEVLINIGGTLYSLAAYMLIFVLLALGFVGGALFSRLSTLVEMKRKQPNGANTYTSHTDI